MFLDGGSVRLEYLRVSRFCNTDLLFRAWRNVNCLIKALLFLIHLLRKKNIPISFDDTFRFGVMKTVLRGRFSVSSSVKFKNFKIWLSALWFAILFLFVKYLNNYFRLIKHEKTEKKSFELLLPLFSRFAN